MIGQRSMMRWTQIPLALAISLGWGSLILRAQEASAEKTAKIDANHGFDANVKVSLDKGVLIVGPPGSTRSLHWRGFLDVHELGPGESLALGSVKVTATEAKHPPGRHPLTQGVPSVGYVISGSQDIYFAGDTGLFPGMADLWPGLDVALLPIAGLGPRLPEVKHLSPRHAVRAMELLRPKLVIPIHWGTYHLPGTVLMGMRRDIHREAPLVFMREAAALQPGIRTVMLEPGGSLDLEPTVAAG